jgi:Glycosyl hydrolase family 57
MTRRKIAPAPASEPASLHLFAVFHLNLAFSSIEESERRNVIERCYWPLLALAATHGPLGIEATGYTLEEIEARDPAWIRRFKELIAAGKAELIGSGYAQMIGPLVPAKVVAANLRIGNATYRDLLGVQPSLALVNEQAYSGGLVGHYLDSGYTALLMDWDNPVAGHPEWPAEMRYLPQSALSADGRTIGLLWTNTVAFQKLQRYAHGDIALDDYVDFVATRRGEHPRALCVYASDGEIFDFRPGRYRSEEILSSQSEWSRLGAVFSALGATDGVKLATPSQALASLKPTRGEPLRLETAAHPVPVKKQRKYNLTRWAVTGRDDIGINAACERIYAALSRDGASDAEWKTLCRLWASDFRTHITEARWNAYCTELALTEAGLGTTPAPLPFLQTAVEAEQRFIEIPTPCLKARLDRRRGLAIHSLAFEDDEPPCVGGLPHGYFDDIGLQADWYTGDCVYEQPGEPKITDLEWAETRIGHNETGDTIVTGAIATPLGPIEKHLTFHAQAPRVDFDVSFHWPEWGRGSLRLGHVTLLPDAWNWRRLVLVTHNGGFATERFALHGHNVDHGAPVSFLVSASCGLGMTEGWAELSDGSRHLRIEVDRQTAPLLGLLTYREVGGSLFCQLVLSMLELDDTRRPTAYHPVHLPAAPRRARFSIIGAGPKTCS